MPTALAQPVALPAPAPGLESGPGRAAAAFPARDAASAPGAKLGGSPPASAPEKAAHPSSDESLGQGGRILFDQAAAPSGADAAEPAVSRASSWGGWVRSLLKRPDRSPAWPGRSGDRIRLEGRTFVLGRRLGEGNSAVVYHAEGGHWGYAVKLIHPGFRGIPYYAAEVEALRDLDRTNIPHAKLIAHSADGLVVVKEFVEGDSGRALLGRGALRASQKENLADLAARFIAIGYTGDLAPGNLVFAHWGDGWTLIDGGGFAMARPWETLKQFLLGDFVEKGGVEPVAFLAAIRGRLGPDSQAWARVLSDAPGAPTLQRYLEALAAADRDRPAGPALEFSPGHADPVLSDSLLSAREVRRRLGYDPATLKPGIRLHTDDPGKLNTVVLQIAPAQGPARVTKRASARIIHNELFLRHVVRRWFGRYFDTPRALGYPVGGGESLLVMEHVAGDKSYVDTRLDLSQRVALALLVHTFGVGDMNEGNILYTGGNGVSLIDFEQALSRSAPNLRRVPDESIAAEMPWLRRRASNHAENYFSGIRQWRELFLRPETQKELAAMLRESGFAPGEVPGLLAVFRANLEDLPWSIQADVEFVNHFSPSPDERAP